MAVASLTVTVLRAASFQAKAPSVPALPEGEWGAQILQGLDSGSGAPL